jgi:predicted nucleic acid-binding protein
MSGWLFDTSILSALSPGRPALSSNTVRWFEERNDDLFLCSILVAETERGIAKLRRLGSTRRSAELAAWFDHVLQVYGDRILSFDLGAAHIAAELSDVAEAIGRHPGFADVAMAAIAKSQDLAVLTLNLRHFEPLGIDILNPLEIV